MSQYPNAKGKDAGKRFTSLNINQTYKGSKGENKSAPGNRSHGLQVLGKVSTRRLTPATLPSLKRENLGNDPSVNLVPSGSGGWGKKESNQSQKQANAAPTTSAGPPKPPQVSGKQLDAPEISLRPNAGVGPSGKQMESGVKTWVQKVNPGQTSDSPYFQKEFPTLGEEGPNKDPDRKDLSEEGEQNANPRGMVPQQINGQKWMENASGMPTQPNIPFHGERPMFNGNQMPYPPYGFIPGPGGRMPIHPYYLAAYAASGGKMPPFDPNFMQRMPKPFVGPPSNKSERPSIVKDSDLKDLDQDKDDHGWDAAQDEVDYNAKLNFDESDESDDDGVSKKNDKDSSKVKSAPSKDKDQQAWPQGYPNFHPQMMNWPRMQFPPGYEPPRGAPPLGPGPHGYPFPQFFMPYGIPPNMQQMQQQMQSKEKPDEQSPPAEGGDSHSNYAPLKADRSEADRKAAAQAKLKALEEKMKEREKKKHEELKVEDLDQPRKSESEDSIRQLPRSRNDSEASDSSRRSSSKEVPPRFQRKRSEQSELIVKDAASETKRAESPHMRIMKRKESVESQKDESVGKDTLKKTERVKDSKLPQESQKKHSTSSDTVEKPSRQTTAYKDAEKKVGRAAPLKGALKDLSETRREKEDKSSKKEYSDFERKKRSDMRTSSQRLGGLGDMKLSKSTKKDSNEELADVFHRKTSNKEKAANKPSAWGKSTPGVKEKVSPVETTKSIVEIQKEEEEENRKHGFTDELAPGDDEKITNDQHSPDEHKFRSDNADRFRNKPAPRSDRPRYEAKTTATDRPRRTDRPDRGERPDRFERKRYDDRRPGDKYNERRKDDGYRRRDDRKERDGDRRDIRDDRRDNRYDRRDARGDRRDNRDDKKDIVDDRKDAREDRKDAHDDSKVEDKKDARNDRKDTRVDRKDTRGDRRDTRDDRKDYRDDRRDTRDDRSYRDKRDRTIRKDYEKPVRDKKSEKRDDWKEESKTESQKPQKADKPEGDGKENKRFGDKREDRRPSNRDRDRRYEQERRPRDHRGEYRGDRRRADERSDIRTLKSTDSKEDVKKPSVLEKSAPSDTKDVAEKRVPEEDKKAPSDSHEESTQPPSIADTTKEEPKGETPSEDKTRIDLDSKENKDYGKETEMQAGGFGLPSETKSYEHKTEKYEHRKTERRSNYDQRRSNYDRDNRYEGRNYPERGRGGRGGRRGTGDRYPRSGRDYRKDLEDISPGELSETEEDKRKDTSQTHKRTRPTSTNWEDTPPRFRQSSRGGRGRGDSSGRGRGESSGRGRGESSGRGRGESSGRGRGESSGRGRGEGRGRGRGQSIRGTRGGRGGGRGSFAHVSEQHRGTPPGEIKEDSSKHDDESERFYSAEESPNSSEEKDDKDEHYKQNQERKPRLSNSGREKRSSLAYKRRGSDRAASRGARNGPFLANRQQVGDKEKLRKSGDDNALPAADQSNSMRTSNGRPTVGGTSTLEEISMHSPPKKIKTLTEKREEKKRDISREFDLNNIASVVCIDDIMPSAQDQQSEKLSEDDGFVMVTSKKHQREQRDRAREEEKKKQKKESLTANKQQKERVSNASRKDSSKEHASPSKGGKVADQTPTTSADTPTTIPTTVITSTTMSTTTVSSVTSAPASNAAMAAIGGWEPAQSLMRTSQQQAPEASKPIVTNVNAWERPLTLTAVSSSAPDPRAVGTGKPSSSQLTSMKANVVPPPPQPTPESASPLVTPPALTPIGTTTTSLVTQVPLKGTSPDKPVKPTEPTSKPKEENTKSSTTKPSAATKKEADERSEKRRSEKVDTKKDNKQSTKRSTREKPPRFQTGGKKEGTSESRGSSKYDKYEDKKYNRDKDRDRRETRDDNKSRKRTADRQRKSDSSKSGESSKSTSKASTSVADKRPTSVVETSTVTSDTVFTSTVTTVEVLPQNTSKSVLSDADKVVGSKKPSLKSQSSFGSYTTPSGESTTADEDIMEIQSQAETFQEPFVLSQTSLQEEDERNANQTARSVIKSLSDEEERSRETRSLPGTPPLVVKIPEPTLSGPSSDPGRAPSPTSTSSKGQVPNMDHEMNEMNRRLYNTRKVWENIPWSEPPSSSAEAQVVTAPSIGTTPSSSNASSVSASIMTTDPPGSPTKSLPDTTPIVSTIADSVKTTEEKPSIAPGFTNVPKRSEQQICKVKPQQQQIVHNDDVIRLNQTKTSVERNINVQSPLSASKYTSYMLPNRALYASTDNAYTEPFRSPNNQFASLSNQVRSTPHSVSTMSQQQRDIMLSSLQVGNISNIYGSSGLQPTTNQVLTWQMVPSSSMQQQTQQPQQPKTVTYPVPNHASLFTTQSLTNNQLIMPYDHSFDPQRSSNNLQRQSINLMQLSQQQQQQTPQHTNQASGIVGMIPTSAHTTARPLRRDQLYRSGMQNNQNINMAALLLNQSTALQQQQQLAAAQQAQNTDLTKHVNAKPFEPTTQGPPLIQSPPVMQQALQMAQQQHIVSTMFRPTQTTNLGNAAPRHQVQGMNHQTLLPTQRQNIQPSMPHHSSPLIASVRPRAVQPINLNALTRSQLSGDRIAAIPMQYPKGNVLNIGQTPRRQGMGGHVTTNLPLSSQSLPNHYMHTAGMQQRNNARNVGVPTVPGPIQRPSQTNQIHHVNYASMPLPPSQIQQPSVSDSGDFKKIQRQKMLEDTKKYFKQQEQQSIAPTVPAEQEKLEEKPLSNGSSAVIGDKKIAFSDMDGEREKTEGSKIIPPKNLNGDRNNRNIKRQTPSGGDLKKKREGSAPQQQSNRRNLPSKV